MLGHQPRLDQSDFCRVSHFAQLRYHILSRSAIRSPCLAFRSPLHGLNPVVLLVLAALALFVADHDSVYHRVLNHVQTAQHALLDERQNQVLWQTQLNSPIQIVNLPLVPSSEETWLISAENSMMISMHQPFFYAPCLDLVDSSSCSAS